MVWASWFLLSRPSRHLQKTCFIKFSSKQFPFSFIIASLCLRHQSQLFVPQQMEKYSIVIIFLLWKNKTKKDSMTDDCLDYKCISFGLVHMLLQGNSIFFCQDLDRFRPHWKGYLSLCSYTNKTHPYRCTIVINWVISYVTVISLLLLGCLKHPTTVNHFDNTLINTVRPV